MGANDDPALRAYRQQREARAELAEALDGFGGGSMTILVDAVLDEGSEEILRQLMEAPEKLYCRGVVIRDEEQRKRVEASLVKLAGCTQALRDATAQPRPPREQEYIERGLGEGPRPPRKRTRGRGR